MGNLVSFWLKTAGEEETQVNSIVEDHLKEQILHTFDPKKADKIFSEGRVSRINNNQSLIINNYHE